MPKLPIQAISPLIPQQAPRYIRDQYPLFVAFIAAYFEWMEQNGQVVNTIFNLPIYFDIDTTLQQFLKHFQDSYLIGIPNNILANPALLERHIKTFYRARGSEKAYELLFQILFNTPVNFYYPGLDIFKLDNNSWNINQVIRTTSNTNTFALVNTIITGITSGVTAAVESVVQLQFNNLIVSEIQLSNISGMFLIGEQITNSSVNVTENIYGLLVGTAITNPGTGYATGDKIVISGGGGISAKAEVNDIGGFDTGRVVSATTNTITLALSANSNNGYYDGMVITLLNGTGSGETNVIESYNGGTQIATLTENWVTTPDITTHYSIALGQILTVTVEDFGIEFTSNPTLNLVEIGNGNATVSGIIGALGTYPGYWLNNDSFLDSTIYLQDDVYYQAFSYVLKTTVSINQYRATVNQLLHPAGTALFGEVEIEQAFQIGPSWKTLELNKFRFPPYQGFSETFPTPNENYFGDPFGPANTQIGYYDPIILNRVISTPDERRNEVSDPYIDITSVIDAIPTNDIVCIYDMIPGVGN